MKLVQVAALATSSCALPPRTLRALRVVLPVLVMGGLE